MRSLLTAHAAQKRRTHGRVLVELVSSNEVDREDNLDVPLLGLLHEGTDLLGASLVEERVTDLRKRRRQEIDIFHGRNWSYGDVLEDLLEGEGHTTANDERVDLARACQI